MIRDEFLANVSLELRTPLTGVLAMTEALQAQTFGPLNERQLQLLQRMEHSGRHLLATINDMLDLSRLDAGLLDLAVDRMCLGTVVPRMRPGRGGSRSSQAAVGALQY